MTDTFIHLHAHSAYSLSEGAIKAEKLPALAKAAGMPAVALTDTANLFGALEFAQACTGKGIQPIMGCQLFLGRGATEEAGRADALRSRPDVLVALAKDAAGLENLQRLSSAGYLGTDPSGEPCVTLDHLGSHAQGLILLTGGTTGPLGRLLATTGTSAATRRLRRAAWAATAAWCAISAATLWTMGATQAAVPIAALAVAVLRARSSAAAAGSPRARSASARRPSGTWR